jgi:hypothetical protein
MYIFLSKSLVNQILNSSFSFFVIEKKSIFDTLAFIKLIILITSVTNYFIAWSSRSRVNFRHTATLAAICWALVANSISLIPNCSLFAASASYYIVWATEGRLYITELAFIAFIWTQLADTKNTRFFVSIRKSGHFDENSRCAFCATV